MQSGRVNQPPSTKILGGQFGHLFCLRGFEPLTSASGGRRLGSVWSEVGGSKSLFVSNLQAGRKFKKVLLTPLVTRFIPSLGTHLSGWRWLYLDRMTTAPAA